MRSCQYAALVVALLVLCCAELAPAQQRAVKKPLLPKQSAVKQIDEIALKKLLVPNGKPLLINFWATWCDPCREEFPELVKINDDYKGKIDFITVSLDDLADINGDVPKFLTEMKATMPAYLLHAADNEAAMKLVSDDWTGDLPFTVLYDETGKIAYFRHGKIRPDILRSELNKETTVVGER